MKFFVRGGIQTRASLTDGQMSDGHADTTFAIVINGLQIKSRRWSSLFSFWNGDSNPERQDDSLA